MATASPDAAHKFCHKCLDFLSLLFKDSQISEDDSNIILGPAYAHSDLQTLFATAPNCKLCNYITECDAVFKMYLDSVIAVKAGITIILQTQKDKDIDLSPIGSAHWTSLMVRAYDVYNEEDSYHGIDLRLTAFPGSAAHQNGDVISRGWFDKSDSAEAFDSIRAWLHSCSEQHGACNMRGPGHAFEASQDPEMPTRILDLGSNSSDVVRLHKTAGLRAKYATLSHCWGPPGKVKPRTTIATLAQHMQGISMSSLSKTFRDAIVVTRAVGIRYLWIDSLCIIQDDKADWRDEAESMGSYYEQSYLTISACATKADSDGLFSQWHRQPEMLEVPYIKEDKVQQGIMLISKIEDDCSHGYSAIAFRGWTAQEQALSRRIIRYHDDGIIWECKECCLTHCGLGRPRLGHDFTSWTSFAQDYSARNLTFSEDRLIAIQGLVNVLRPTRDDEYLAGFWKKDLPLQLLWRSDNTLQTNPGLSQFPSWSWTSKIGDMAFFGQAWFEHPQCKAVCQLVDTKTSGAITILGSVIVCKGLQFDNLVKTHGESREQDMLMGIVEPNITWTEGLNNSVLPEGPFLGHVVIITDKSAQVCGWALFDMADSYAPQRGMVARLILGKMNLLLVAVSAQVDSSSYGLVLLLQRRKIFRGLYSRVGMGLVGGHLLQKLSVTKQRPLILE